MQSRSSFGFAFLVFSVLAGTSHASCTMGSPGPGWKKAGPAYKAIYDCRDTACGRGSRVEMAWKKRATLRGLAGADRGIMNGGGKIGSPISGRQAYRKINSRSGKFQVLETHRQGSDSLADAVLIFSTATVKSVAIANAGAAARAVSCR